MYLDLQPSADHCFFCLAVRSNSSLKEQKQLDVILLFVHKGLKIQIAFAKNKDSKAQQIYCLSWIQQ